MPLYEYAVILDDKRNRQGELVEPGEIVVPVKQVFAKDEVQANLLAARAIPEDLVANGKLDRLMVVVRPF